MDNRIAIISDVHGNLEALLAVLALIPPGTRIICLGDVVGYGPDPNACVELLRGRNAVILKGNHDAAVSDDGALAWFNPLAREALLWTRSTLSADNCRYLGRLPEVLRENRTVFVHGTPMNPVSEYIDRSKADAFILSEPGGNFCFAGHTHEMVVYGIDTTQAHPGDFNAVLQRPSVINIGSVGQPRDGNPLALVCFWNPEGFLLEGFRVKYDVAVTQRKMQEAGLPRPIIARLSLGL